MNYKYNAECEYVKKLKTLDIHNKLPRMSRKKRNYILHKMFRTTSPVTITLMNNKLITTLQGTVDKEFVTPLASCNDYPRGLLSGTLINCRIPSIVLHVPYKSIPLGFI